jgi:hypothetical protein
MLDVVFCGLAVNDQIIKLVETEFPEHPPEPYSWFSGIYRQSFFKPMDK